MPSDSVQHNGQMQLDRVFSTSHRSGIVKTNTALERLLLVVHAVTTRDRRTRAPHGRGPDQFTRWTLFF